MPRRRPRPRPHPPSTAAHSPSRDTDTSSDALSARRGAAAAPTAARATPTARSARLATLQARVEAARAEHADLMTRTTLLDARERQVAAAEAALAAARAARAGAAALDPLLCDAVDALRRDAARPNADALAAAALADGVVAGAFAAGDGTRTLSPSAAAVLATRLSIDVTVGPAAGTRVSLADILHWPAATVIQTVAAAKAEIARALSAAARADSDAVSALAAIDDAGAAARALDDLFVAFVTYRHASVGTVARAQLLAAGGGDGGSSDGDDDAARVSAATLVDRLAIFASPRQVGALLTFRADYVRRVAAARARRDGLLATLRGTLLTGSVDGNASTSTATAAAPSLPRTAYADAVRAACELRDGVTDEAAARVDLAIAASAPVDGALSVRQRLLYFALVPGPTMVPDVVEEVARRVGLPPAAGVLAGVAQL